MRALLIGVLLCLGPVPFDSAYGLAQGEHEQAALLKTFRDEFVDIKAEPAYRMAKVEVPQNLWESVTGSNPSKWKGKRNSVEMLSYDEAVGFCKKVTELLLAAKLID